MKKLTLSSPKKDTHLRFIFRGCESVNHKLNSTDNLFSNIDSTKIFNPTF